MSSCGDDKLRLSTAADFFVNHGQTSHNQSGQCKTTSGQATYSKPATCKPITRSKMQSIHVCTRLLSVQQRTKTPLTTADQSINARSSQVQGSHADRDIKVDQANKQRPRTRTMASTTKPSSSHRVSCSSRRAVHPSNILLNN